MIHIKYACRVYGEADLGALGRALPSGLNLGAPTDRVSHACAPRRSESIGRAASGDGGGLLHRASRLGRGSRTAKDNALASPHVQSIRRHEAAR